MPKLPDYLGPYQRTRFIHAGSCTQVWRAVKSDGSGRFVLKILSSQHWQDRHAIASLKHEYEVAHTFEHPNIVRVLEFRIEHKIPFLALELFSDRNVKTILREEGHDEVLQLLPKIVVQGATALHSLHEKKWVHCNVKPENFLLNEKAQLKLIDFAIAQRAKKGRRSSLLHKHGQVRGTRSYMSPEQIHGEAVDGRSDIYSLGCVLFELYAGKVPYTGKNPSDVLNKHLKAPIPSVQMHNHSVSDAVAALIARMMAKEPQSRPNTMAEVLSEFRAAHRGNVGEGMTVGSYGSAGGRPSAGRQERAANAAPTESQPNEAAGGMEPSVPAGGMIGGAAGPSSGGLFAFASEAKELGKTQLKEAAHRVRRAVLSAPAARAVRLLRSRVTQAVLALLVVGVIVLLYMRPPLPGWEKDVHAQFTWVYHRIYQLRQSEAPPQAWAQLAEEAQAVVADSAGKLHDQAIRTRPDLHELIQASMLLPQAVQAARAAKGRVPRSEERLAYHLENAEQQMQQRAQARADRPGVWASVVSVSRGVFGSNVFYWAVIAFDVLAGLWILRLLFRGRGKRSVEKPEAPKQ